MAGAITGLVALDPLRSSGGVGAGWSGFGFPGWLAAERADLTTFGDQDQEILRGEVRRSGKEHLLVFRALEHVLAGRRPVGRVVGAQLAGDARHDERSAAQQWTR